MMAESPKMSVLPEELIIEIISRVDSRNTLQLRPVCKRWNSLITDPEFAYYDEIVHVDMQTQSQALEDIMKCFRSFVRIYLKS